MGAGLRRCARVRTAIWIAGTLSDRDQTHSFAIPNGIAYVFADLGGNVVVRAIISECAGARFGAQTKVLLTEYKK